ncbi:MAG: hypothetical protein EOM26_08100 [Alphaproteobacteria bacterium]|nr:hypothetical protein [Alphaproteobacteria bacterium]
MQKTLRNARFIKPPNKIKQKVGGGGFEPDVAKKGQKAIDDTDVDFAPYAEKYLKDLAEVIADYEHGRISNEDTRERLAATVMQLKANGGMFSYSLISEIADTILLLLDNISDLNRDALDIVKAHQNSIQIIVATRLKGSGGREGSELVRELGNACTRFYTKYGISPQ